MQDIDYKNLKTLVLSKHFVEIKCLNFYLPYTRVQIDVHYYQRNFKQPYKIVLNAITLNKDVKNQYYTFDGKDLYGLFNKARIMFDHFQKLALGNKKYYSKWRVVINGR